jgi:hypothetical protein
MFQQKRFFFFFFTRTKIIWSQWRMSLLLLLLLLLWPECWQVETPVACGLWPSQRIFVWDRASTPWRAQ